MCELLVDSGAEIPLGAAYALSNFVIGSASTAPITEQESHASVDTAIAPQYARLHAGYHDAVAEKIVTAGVSAPHAL